jgi:hypothetical protein
MTDTDDRYDQLCTECEMGRYHETSIHDDWDGVLHCTNKKCNHEVKRYKHKDNPQPENLYNEIIKSTQMTNTFDRDSLIEDFAMAVLDDMDLETLTQLAFDYLTADLAEQTDNEIVKEVNEYYPNLITEHNIDPDIYI